MIIVGIITIFKNMEIHSLNNTHGKPQFESRQWLGDSFTEWKHRLIQKFMEPIETYFNWFKLVTWLAAANQSALFKFSLAMLLLNLFTTGVISDAESLKIFFLLLRLKRLCFFVRIFFVKEEKKTHKSRTPKKLYNSFSWKSWTVWPDLGKFRHFCKSLQVFGKFLEG